MRRARLYAALISEPLPPMDAITCVQVTCSHPHRALSLFLLALLFSLTPT